MNYYIFDRERNNTLKDDGGDNLSFKSSGEIWNYLKGGCGFTTEFIKTNFFIMQGQKILEPEDSIDISTPNNPVNETVKVDVEEVTGVNSYTKKPVEIKAIQWNGNTNKADVEAFVGRPLKTELESETAYVAGVAPPLFSLIIETKEGAMKAFPNDWIIKEPFPTGDRDFYPCKPDIFKMTYDKPQPQSENNILEDLALQIIAGELEKSGLRKYTCINNHGYSQVERNIASNILKAALSTVNQGESKPDSKEK